MKNPSVFKTQNMSSLLRHICILARHNLYSGKTQSIFWEGAISVLARHNLCCGKTRSWLWQDIREAAFGRLHKGVWRFAPPLFVDSLMSCHSRDLVLPQQRSCLATTHILFCRSRDHVLPQHTSCLATTEILGLVPDPALRPPQGTAQGQRISPWEWASSL